jgi:DNA-binding NarL/FixJ family response regulator
VSGYSDRERDEREAREDAEEAALDRMMADFRRVPPIPEGGHDGSEQSEREANALIDDYVDNRTRARLHQPHAPRDLPAYGNPRGTLSVDELKVLSLRSHGKTLEEVAAETGAGLETVKTRLRTAKYKLEAKSPLHACCQAIRQGLIE